ncbi:type I phosphodiesterase/nucleotide pyrophosphatase/phosphate transferase family protein [Rhodotorula toruloides]|uniref:Type I phosphodiesterase/nucleotide pyrophosphatase/phosphate transferase family protein n=1 Tax=Rhodotorula toruloides TaxID=5286 RepID=A0A511KJD5_RHOTO|nr:type I phosphodiesterase/nucleotide pyrophosphatase/phosphate transferase family protein [Rhodotorula toruloides]
MPLAGASTASLLGRPRDGHVTIPGRLDTELDDKGDGRDEGDVDDDSAVETGRTGLLSGREKDDEDGDAGADDLEEEARRLTGAEEVPKRRRRVIFVPLVLWCCVALGSAILVVLIFRPSVPFLSSSSPSTLPALSASDATYYSGQALSAGVYRPDLAHVAPNPLPSDGKYADVPFAQVGQSWDKSGKTPTWAGGDWGEKELEGGLRGGQGRRWNGTHWWDPTVVLISLDGVRADHLERGLTPHLLNISRKGIRAEYMEPSFPSLTFPNHWTLLTGLYPSAHGIVANDFYDPQLDKEFVYTEPGKSWGSEWWGGEPIWATATKSSLRSAVLMWPGPPVMSDGTKPTYWYPFVDRYHYRKKVKKVAGWLDMDYTHRPHLMTVYLPEVDQVGHKTGPDSRSVAKTLSAVDEFVREVMEEVDRRNVTDVVDVVVVSDHGMAATSNKRLIFLDDILGPSGFASISHNEGWPSAGLLFKPDTDVPAMYKRLKDAADKKGSGFKCYDQGSMPERWHFTGHARISPIYCVPDVGWAITNHHELEVAMNGTYSVKGNHGYDPADASMHAIFVAHGPFASSVKSKTRQRSRLARGKSPIQPIPADPNTLVVPAFKNTEVYGLLARLLGVARDKRAQTNGTSGFWEEYLGPEGEE